MYSSAQFIGMYNSSAFWRFNDGGNAMSMVPLSLFPNPNWFFRFV